MVSYARDGIHQFALVFAVAVVLVNTAQASGRRIEEASFVKVGGIEQWVTIRGDDDRKPVLLLLHGGPGDVQSPFISPYAAGSEFRTASAFGDRIFTA